MNGKPNTYKFQLSHKATIFIIYIGAKTREDAERDVTERYSDKYKIKYIGSDEE